MTKEDRENVISAAAVLLSLDLEEGGSAASFREKCRRWRIPKWAAEQVLKEHLEDDPLDELEAVVEAREQW
jgi:hypothetical protein